MTRKKALRVIINETIEVEPDGIYKAKVIPSGNGAVISFFKRFIGKNVFVIVIDKIKKDGG